MKPGFGEVQVAVTGGFAVLQQLATSSQVVPLVFIAYLFFKAWLDYCVQVKSLPNASQRTETDRPARGADVMQVAPPSTEPEEDIAS